MTNTMLGRLEKVDLRTAWPNEAGDFTPWLAQAENLRLLGETIGLELECECQEKPVGPFSADILCRDSATGEWVLIENQIERTDHTHLGQLLTYAAGLKAATIVWVAKEFRDEHRAALDWLNEITSENFNFFGLEVELWRIGNSPAAPKFNIVCQPNEWARKERRAVEHSETAMAHLEYWTAFAEHLSNAGFPHQARPRARAGIGFSIGRGGFRIGVAVTTWDLQSERYSDPELRVSLTINHPDAHELMDELQQHRERIDTALGSEVYWHRKDGQQRCRIYQRRFANPEDLSDWPAQHEWLQERLAKFEQLFRPLVAQLGHN